MKRTLDRTKFNVENEKKKMLVEREDQPLGVDLISSLRVGKTNAEDAMELVEDRNTAINFTQANATNKLEMIGQQMKSLESLLKNVITETKQNAELHKAACNFVKIPGNIYHLYQRPSGQKYFSMLSPQEWREAPHTFLGSYRLEADQSWTPAENLPNKFEGINYLLSMYSRNESLQCSSNNILSQIMQNNNDKME